jgi:hypothetical protein
MVRTATALLAVISASHLAFAGETIHGKIAEVKADAIKISSDSEFSPNVGDKVEVYVEIPGFPEGAVVGTGKVTEVGDLITAKIENNSAALKKDQRVRIHHGRNR